MPIIEADIMVNKILVRCGSCKYFTKVESDDFWGYCHSEWVVNRVTNIGYYPPGFRKDFSCGNGKLRKKGGSNK